MYKVVPTAKYRKDYKRMFRQGRDLNKLKKAVAILAATGKLPPEYHDHALTGEWTGHRECHITPDWLLVYIIDKGVLVLTLTETGTHADIFGT
jgi:mRNA interferase YafQ